MIDYCQPIMGVCKPGTNLGWAPELKNCPKVGLILGSKFLIAQVGPISANSNISSLIYLYLSYRTNSGPQLAQRLSKLKKSSLIHLYFFCRPNSRRRFSNVCETQFN